MPDSKFPYYLAAAVAAVLMFGSVEALKAFTAYLKNAGLATQSEAVPSAIVSVDDASPPPVGD